MEFMKLDDETLHYIASINSKTDTLGHWIEEVRAKIKSTFETPEGTSCLVFNANPCTLGHRYLMELASKRNRGVVVFVIQGKTSSGSKGNHENTGLEIPFDVRLKDVEDCARNFHNVLVLSGGPYIISRDDFPSQWSTKEKSKAHSYAILNAKLLCQVILPELGIKTFYVGDEPRDELEEMHLNELRTQCKICNINLKVAERKRFRDKYISSAMAREAIFCKDWETVKQIVPELVYERLKN